jgi:hypothetical protein
LQQLQSSNPSEFNQVLQDAASKFQTAASQATDPNQQKGLQAIANQFSQAASSDNLSALAPPSSSNGGSTGQIAGYGHHHHHAASGSSSTGPSSSTTAANTLDQSLIQSVLNSGRTPQSSSASQTQQLLGSLLSS